LNGILTSDEVQDFAKAIIGLADNKKFRDNMRKNARNSIQSFDFNNIAEKYLIPQYEKILS
jgi:glycosyltransferase involved in cell wall biosynthesis